MSILFVIDSDFTKFVTQTSQAYQQDLLSKLEKPSLLTKLIRKNVYHARSKNLNKSSDLIAWWFNAYVSSIEETDYGMVLEECARYILTKRGGFKSSFEGIDLEIECDDSYELHQVKSGDKWGNHTAYRGLGFFFEDAVKKLNTSKKIRCINGCCYGKGNSLTTYGYEKICGKAYWELLTGNANFASELMTTLGNASSVNNDVYQAKLDTIKSKLVLSFNKSFLMKDGSIDWLKLIK